MFMLLCLFQNECLKLRVYIALMPFIKENIISKVCEPNFGFIFDGNSIVNTTFLYFISY